MTEARIVHEALDQYVENLGDLEGEPEAANLDLARKILDRCSSAFAALAVGS